MKRIKVHIFPYGEWCAIYVDGRLIHWHDDPSNYGLLRRLGIDVKQQDMPAAIAKIADENNNGADWSPPDRIEEFWKLAKSEEDRALEEEIRLTEKKLAELEKRRR